MIKEYKEKQQGGPAVNAKGDANRSVRETKRKLGAALVELLQKKPVQQITVR